ncbi:MAG: 2-hydroxyacyl-CoA dehydratase [Candidatus Riflebacteria bacterium]|nr:2-hydroxyacyl-CoA dehydratase [Candidatus Riflebacteria bacterium]
MLDAVVSGSPADLVVLTTACDQMRHAADVLEQRRAPVFLLNLPSTRQTPTARAIYGEELMRLGRLLVRLGGRSPGPGELAQEMARFDEARASLLAARGDLPAAVFARASIDVRTDAGTRVPPRPDPRVDAAGPRGRVTALALAGGPVLDEDLGLLEWVESAGGRFVLDASEWGEGTLPRPFDRERSDGWPLVELVDAYLGSIPDVFSRPNDAFHEYFRREIRARDVRGVVVLRRLWCDLWHAEIDRLRSAEVPVLDLVVDPIEDRLSGATLGRLEALLESLG